MSTTRCLAKAFEPVPAFASPDVQLLHVVVLLVRQLRPSPV